MCITCKTIEELSQGLQNKEFSSHELTQAYLKRIEEIEPYIRAYITLTPERALAAAEASDQRRAARRALSPLDGIPIAVKDLFCTNGVLTTCASKMLYNFVPPYDATCWAKLEQAGGVLLGKTNMDEFAMGSSTESSAYGLTRNPFDLDYVPGGSSGGSAAAVAADLAACALGTDTGGSTRQPAHYCGVVGIKPTYGRISRYGIIPYASSLDQAGIFAKTVYDAATMLEIVAGQDELDATSAPLAVGDYREACRQSVRGLKIGLPREMMAAGLGEATLQTLLEAADLLREAGAVVEEISLPHTPYALPAYYIIAMAEASSNLARYDGVRFGLREQGDNLHDMMIATRTEGFGEEVKTRIILGTYVLSAGYADAYYQRALQIRTLVRRDYQQAFAQGYDCLLGPVCADPAFKFGAMEHDPMAMYITDICTVPINMAGLPAMTIPFRQHEGLPIGLQLIGQPFGEETIFKVGAAMEQPRMLPPDILAQAAQKGVNCHD